MAGAPFVVTAKILPMSIGSSKCSINTLAMSSPFVVSDIGCKQQNSSLTVESEYFAMTAKREQITKKVLDCRRYSSAAQPPVLLILSSLRLLPPPPFVSSVPFCCLRDTSDHVAEEEAN
ncbi:unnamed protein product [Pleuronectes platessa]|uniref:Uncharacterized protein n=1 Tax=Pleuronectes platessa TaxID=8262 RepID=A0A9N7V9I6_PLEPL|nr:unnamed protein product [Pleuronectes platessa]